MGHDVGTCETVGVLEPAIAAVTAFQSAEALKILVGRGAETTRGIFTCDVFRGSYAVLAAVHVWLEFPALLLALGLRAPAPRLA